MILITRFLVNESKESELQFEIELRWDSDTEALRMFKVVKIPLSMGLAGSMIAKQEAVRYFPNIPGCALLDIIGEYNKMGQVLDIQLFTHAEYEALNNANKRLL